MAQTRKSPETCIYCGAKAKITREHIFGKWLKKHFPEITGNTDHYTSLEYLDLDTGKIVNPSMAKGRLHRTGPPHVQQIKIVCAKCNETWMGDIQKAAQPLFVDLISGKWPSFTFDSMTTLARWAVMATISLEFADPGTNTSTQDDRTGFMTEGQPGPDWRVCVGFCKSGSPGEFWHRAFGVLKETAERVPDEQILAQTTTFPIGRCLIHTMRDPREEAIPDGASYASDLGLRQFWPLPEVVPVSAPDFNIGGMIRVATLYSVRCGQPPLPHGGMLLPSG